MLHIHVDMQGYLRLPFDRSSRSFVLGQLAVRHEKKERKIHLLSTNRIPVELDDQILKKNTIVYFTY